MSLRRFGGRRGIRGVHRASSGSAAPDPRLLLYSDGTFARSTEASLPLIFQPGDTITWHGANVLRQSSILTPDGLPYFAFEGSRTNQILQSRQPGGASWSTVAPITRGADAATGPDGAAAADRLQTGPTTGAAYQPTGVHGAGSKVATSIFAKMSDTEAVHHWRYGTGLTDAGTTHATDTITAQWQRFVIVHTANAAAEDYIVVAEAADQTSIGGYAALDQDLYLDLCQAEPGAAFPSSVIRTTTAQATRPEDRLTIAQASVPAEFGTGKWHIYFRALWTHAEAASNARIFQIGATNQFSLWWDAGAATWRLYKNATLLASRGGTWSRGQEILFTVDSTGAGALTIAGMTTGDGITAFASNPAYTAGDLIIGGYTSTGFSAFGLISEPVLEAA